MHEYLSNAIKIRLLEANSSTNPRNITDKLKEILNILSQTGEYDGFDEPEIKILKEMLQSSNLTIVEYSIRVLAGLNHTYLLRNADTLKDHEDWLIRLLMYDFIFYFQGIERISLLKTIFDKEDHRVRWHLLNYISSLDSFKRESIDLFFAEMINDKKNLINQILAHYYFSLINPSVYLKKLLNFIKNIEVNSQEEIDIIEIIALNLAKTKSSIAVDTLTQLYNIYKEIKDASKHFGFFIDGYLELLLQYPTECISIFQTFLSPHQQEIAKSMIKHKFQNQIIEKFLQLTDLDEEIKQILINGKKQEDSSQDENTKLKDTSKMEILL